jgi:hypothetical protein
MARYGIVLIHPVYGRTAIYTRFKTVKDAEEHARKRLIKGANMTFEVVKV